MTPREWASCIDGYMLREEDEWRRTRAIYALIYNTHVESRHQLSAEELLPLPGDKKDKQQAKTVHARYPTDEEREKLLKLYKVK